ncbi:helix-turn-helix domain-containing protein [Amedibacterium intestinale]|uniref:helix-turn-helix domain-containing protein n=1 Tax=Amedibacterium intestinale TaxID=2583452 RepID=UPI000E205998
MSSKDMIASRIKLLRKEKGLTQKELSNISGISFKSIVNYENKVREPNSKAMAALEKVFNVSGSYLRGETDIREPMLWDDEEIMDQIDKDFLTSMKALSNLCLKQTDKNKKLLFDFFVEFRCLINSVDNDDDLTTITDIMTKNSNALERLIKNK